MDVVCVMDACQSGGLAQRKRALEEVRVACTQIGANLNHIQVKTKNKKMFRLFMKFVSVREVGFRRSERTEQFLQCRHRHRRLIGSSAAEHVVLPFGRSRKFQHEAEYSVV